MNSHSTETTQIKLSKAWLEYLRPEFDQPYMKQLGEFLRAEKRAGKIIYPTGDNIFNALNSTPPEKVRVVVLGQDPYHGPNQAHGLSFSVPEGIKPPPSLVNIYKELASDLGLPIPQSGNLQHWANDGVLLLNAVLTVQQANAGSHAGKGWEQFTDKIIAILNQHFEGVVYMLWGSYAQKKGAMIDTKKNLVLRAPHPSPLSAHRGFFGCKHFSAAQNYLADRGESFSWVS